MTGELGTEKFSDKFSIMPKDCLLSLLIRLHVLCKLDIQKQETVEHLIHLHKFICLDLP